MDYRYKKVDQQTLHHLKTKVEKIDGVLRIFGTPLSTKLIANEGDRVVAATATKYRAYDSNNKPIVPEDSFWLITRIYTH